MTIPRILWNVASGAVRRRFAVPPPGIGVEFPSVWRSRIGLIDIDTNFHLNNSSYFTQMELALDYMIGYTGIADRVFRDGWYFLIGSHAIRYRHSIQPGIPFEVHTQAIYWDDTWVYLRARFVCPASGKLYAEGITRTMVRKGKETIPPPDILRCSYPANDTRDFAAPSEVPPLVRDFLQWDASSASSMKSYSFQGLGNIGHRISQSMNLPWAKFQVPKWPQN